MLPELKSSDLTDLGGICSYKEMLGTMPVAHMVYDREDYVASIAEQTIR